MSTYFATSVGWPNAWIWSTFIAALSTDEPDCLRLGGRGPPRPPGFWYTRFAPVGDSTNYGSEFFAFVGQRVGEARRVPLVKSRLNQAATFQQL